MWVSLKISALAMRGKCSREFKAEADFASDCIDVPDSIFRFRVLQVRVCLFETVHLEVVASKV
jgi:hypothetical protein